jgi:hypothetical protein
MPQLQINQGPQDALLYDNSRSYFTNVGYVRTSNFQVEYREVEAQNDAKLGSTVQFVIPKAADLLGPCDLRVEIPAALTTATLAANAVGEAYSQWVDELGFAMIEKITFSVGSNDIETITGEMLQIKNELMTSDEMRLGHGHTLKTGIAMTDPGYTTDVKNDYSRTILSYSAAGASTVTPTAAKKRFLVVPLGLFFTKHVSQYFPLAAVAGCNDVRISIKFRPMNELIQVKTGGGMTPSLNPDFTGGKHFDKCCLLCHYVHVTGPEAQVLMNKEHVRLLKLYQHDTKTMKSVKGKFDLDLSFLHPISTLLITIRRENDMNSEADTNNAQAKGLFFYHGDGTNPNYDAPTTHVGTCKVSSIQLTLNGQERHPGLSQGIDYHYLRERLVPMLHSNSNQSERMVMGLTGSDDSKLDYALKGSKNIIVYPFSLNPEGTNPSGAVNFSKVSHAKLTIHLDDTWHTNTVDNAVANPAGGTDASNYVVDVYGLYYNWLQIKDGRALLSFA